MLMCLVIPCVCFMKIATVNGQDPDNHRSDGRCGPDYPGPDGGEGVCLADGIWPCCSTYSWCGNTAEHCEIHLYRDFREDIQITDNSPCPPGWQMFRDNCYFLNHAARVDYAQASIECISMGARLVSIHSMEQQDFLVGNLQYDRENHFYYIGLNDKAEENTFVWSDGTPLDFEDWKSDEPNDYNDGEDCGSLWPRENGQWNDLPCHTNQAYICKRGKAMCSGALGMEDGTITDDQLSVSSEGKYGNRGPSRARLNQRREGDLRGGWGSGGLDTNQWIQVEFRQRMTVTAVILQGREDYGQWVETYKVEYAVDSGVWFFVVDGNNEEQVFIGNTDRTTPITQQFTKQITVIALRIRPQSWHDRINMRFELLGCHEPDITTTIDATTKISTYETVSIELPTTQKSDILATMTNIVIWKSHGTTDSRSLLGNQTFSASTATGVSIASVFLLIIISCVVVLVIVKRRKQQENRKSQNVIQLDGPYGDITNIITHQHTKDTNTYEGVDNTNISASQLTGVEGDGKLYQNVPVDRSGQERESAEETYQDISDEQSGHPEDNDELYEDVPTAGGPSQVKESADDTYQDVMDDQTNKQPDGKTDEELYQDIRDIDEHDYVAVDAEKTEAFVDKADGGLIESYARSQYGGAPCPENVNQLEGWVDNDIYAKSDEELPKRQNGEDNKTEGWVENDIYTRS